MIDLIRSPIYRKPVWVGRPRTSREDFKTVRMCRRLRVLSIRVKTLTLCCFGRGSSPLCTRTSTSVVTFNIPLRVTKSLKLHVVNL